MARAPGFLWVPARQPRPAGPKSASHAPEAQTAPVGRGGSRPGLRRCEVSVRGRVDRTGIRGQCERDAPGASMYDATMKHHISTITRGRMPGGRLQAGGRDSRTLARRAGLRDSLRVRRLSAQARQLNVDVFGVSGGLLESDVALCRVLIGEQAPCGGRTQDGARREPGWCGRGRGFVRRATLTERPSRNCRCGGRPRASRRDSRQSATQTSTATPRGSARARARITGMRQSGKEQRTRLIELARVLLRLLQDRIVFERGAETHDRAATPRSGEVWTVSSRVEEFRRRRRPAGAASPCVRCPGLTASERAMRTKCRLA